MRKDIQLITVTVLANRLKVSSSTLKKWEAQGKIPKAKRTPGNWRFYDPDIAQTIEDQFNKQPI